MNYRPYYADYDYSIVSEWWEQRDGAVVKPEWLSTLGIVALEEGEPVAMTWLYLSNSKMAQLGWTTTKPGLGNRKSYKAVKTLLEAAKMIARKSGVTYLHSMSNKSGLTKLMKKAGFVDKLGYNYLAYVGG